MTYQPRPFASNDTLVASRDQIRTNFELLQTSLGDNHVPPGDPNAGNHTRIDFVIQTTFPATAADESWLLTRDYTSGGTPRVELGWRPEGEAGGGDIFYLSAMPIRAAGYFIVGVAGAQTLLGRSFNVNAVTWNSATDILIQFDNVLPSTNYWIIGSSWAASGKPEDGVGIKTAGKATNQCSVRPGAGTAGTLISFVIMGG